MTTALKQSLEDALGKARHIADTAVAEDRSFTEEERTQVAGYFEEAKAAKAALDVAKADASMLAELSGMNAGFDPASVVSLETVSTAKSLGAKFTGSDSIKSWYKDQAPTGQIPKSARVHSPAVQFDGMKDMLSSGGSTLSTDAYGLVDTAQYGTEQFVLRSLVTNGTTSGDMIEYVRIIDETNNAAVAPEAQGGTTPVVGLKPESELVLEPATAKVVTIAHWLTVTKKALSDAQQVQTMIDNFMRWGLEAALENDMISGNGGEEFEGVLNTNGIQAQPWNSDLLTTTRKARTLVKTVGHSVPTAYVFNPVDNERLDLLKTTTGELLFGPPTGATVQTLWGLPRIESEAVPAGVGILADWRQAVLWDRQQSSIQISDSHADYFVRNLVAILGELRAAFSVIRPAAFVEIDLTA